MVRLHKLQLEFSFEILQWLPFVIGSIPRLASPESHCRHALPDRFQFDRGDFVCKSWKSLAGRESSIVPCTLLDVHPWCICLQPIKRHGLSEQFAVFFDPVCSSSRVCVPMRVPAPERMVACGTEPQMPRQRQVVVPDCNHVSRQDFDRRAPLLTNQAEAGRMIHHADARHIALKHLDQRVG